MASYNKPRTVNGVINTVYNAEDYADQSAKGEYVDKISNESVGGLKTFTMGIMNTGNTVVGDASSDTLTVNATSTFNAPVDLSSATGSVIPGKYITSDTDGRFSIATSNTMTGVNNTFINSSNNKTITRTFNLVIGNAATNLTSGSNNVIMGYENFTGSTTGANVLVGTSCGAASNTDNCTMIGFRVARFSTSAQNCVGIGSNALARNNGNFNTAIGANSGTTNPLNCSNTTFLGAQTGGSFSNSTAIGYSAQLTANNQMVFGVSATTLNSPNLSGTGNRALYADPNENFTTSSSDSRLKENIVYLANSESLTKLLQLKPAKWDWIKNGNKDYGLIAQDLQTVMPDLVFSTPDYSNVEYDISTGEIIESTIEHYLGINYHQLTPYLISSIQALNTKINDQNTMISGLMAQVASLMERTSALENA